MVLRTSRSLAFALASACAAFTPSALLAQSLPDVAPALSRDDPEYEIEPTVVGPIAITLRADASVEHDGNVFALPDDAVSDAVFSLSTHAGLTHRSGNLTTNFDTDLSIRRFANQTSQDTEAVSFDAGLAWAPRQAETFTIGAGWERAIEDRGDPEARRATALGPRQIDISSLNAGYRRARGKLLLDLQAEATKFDARAAIDDDRDFSIYGGTAKLGLRVGGQMFATASVFATERNFRLPVSSLGINRDATIYGGRVGVDIAPGGLFEGNVSVGVFRNEPEDQTLDSRTGLSVEGLLIYRPSRRAALIFDASRGDVATFRGGASGRTDTTARFTWEHEVRHNLYSSMSVGYRESDFFGSVVSEETLIARGELEFLVSRSVSLVGQMSYGSRESEVALEEFDRFRGGIGVRLRF